MPVTTRAPPFPPVLTVRPAQAEDADQMGALHVRAWRAAYRGQMPDSYLDGLEPSSRADMWRRSAASPRDRSRLLVADLDGIVVAFAAVGPGGDAPAVGQLYAINVEPDRQGQGVGRTLLGAAQDALATLGFTEAILWVLPSNQCARRFYERAGWRAEDVERAVDVLGVTVREIRYRISLVPAS